MLDDTGWEMTDKEILDKTAEWAPGVKKPAKSAQDKALELLKGLSAEELEAVLSQATG